MQQALESIGLTEEEFIAYCKILQCQDRVQKKLENIQQIPRADYEQGCDYEKQVIESLQCFELCIEYGKCVISLFKRKLEYARKDPACEKARLYLGIKD